MKQILAILLFCAAVFQPDYAGAQGTKRPLKTATVDTAFLLPVNGVKQYLEIKGASADKPILLFIHGGPSWPATPTNRKYSQDLTKDFVFVSWDQRNCGKSQTDTTVTLTPELYVADAHVVTQFLQKHYHRRKIFVVGHSWGSLIGVMLVQQYPQDYAAYIGMGQMVNPGKSELLAKNYVVQQATLQKDTATLAALAKISFNQDGSYQNGLAGLMQFRMLSDKYLSSKEEVELPNPMTLYADYQALDWMTPVMRAGKQLDRYISGGKTDLMQRPTFQLPVYFVVGKYDHTTSAELAQQYFATIKAPKKQLFLFEHSGHAPSWQEPPLFRTRLLQIAAANPTK
ncbi:alpha/beta fold hydrolase [Hymenobacter sp. AT01-02]|uniref:alpha/beta fold hydrolase n=1 Tax=Hymenobacter sp. AT01-02 TaxID=1571877 RepID=UPI0006E194CF|nr:alpha/beta hydrolase [Hymenobacter sp. AT01-02]